MSFSSIISRGIKLIIVLLIAVLLIFVGFKFIHRGHHEEHKVAFNAWGGLACHQ